MISCEVVIDTPQFDYLKYGGAELSHIKYTFDVDTQSTLYKFMKARLRSTPCSITILV